MRSAFMLIVSFVIVLSASTSHAGDYPDRPIKLVVGFGVGGPTDIPARFIAEKLSQSLGQRVVVENKPASGGIVATRDVVARPPDGYTLLLCTHFDSINIAAYKNPGFKLADLTPISLIARYYYGLAVANAVPVTDMRSFIAYAKAHPGITVASAGSGTVTHVSGEMFKIMTGIETVHVAYRGEPQALTDLIAGQVNCDFNTLTGAAEFIRTGKLRALGVTTAQRSEIFPDIPAIGEFVPGYEANLWNGIGAPRATPPEIIAKLNAAINAGLNDPKVKAQFAELGSVTVPLTPAEYGKVIVTETERWGKVIRAAGIKAE